MVIGIIRKIQITDEILSVGKMSLLTNFINEKIFGQLTDKFTDRFMLIITDKFIDKKIYRQIIHQ